MYYLGNPKVHGVRIMATLNLSPTGHGSKSETYADGSTIQYNTFPANVPGFSNVERAMDILGDLAQREPSQGQCNSYFRSLGNGNSFSGLWQNPAVFVDHSPSTQLGFYAACHSNNRDLTLTHWCISTQNRWMLAATLCHELAHAAGAPGGASHAAELAASKCYFGDQYDTNILGSVDTIYRYLRSAYA